jgi:acetylornithine deacetylase/succinyl-diaminopimelate desuccinylase family protein
VFGCRANYNKPIQGPPAEKELTMEMSPDPVGLIDTLARLVAANTENPPGREIEAARYLADRLAGFGLAVEMRDIADERPNVVARLGNGPGPVFAFNSHMDVVPAGSGWTSDPFTLRRDAGRLFGRGACDAKGSIAAMLEAIRMLCALRDRWSGTLLAVFVVDEEVASRGARAFVRDRPQVDLCVVGEPTSNMVVVAHKGSMRPVVRVTGVPAHSASPDKGDNALYKAASLLLMIEKRHRMLAAGSHPLLGSPSLTVTRIHGGHADNVVPDSCELLLDRRMLPGESEDDVRIQFEKLLAEAKALHGVDAEIVEYRATTGGATETRADHPVVLSAVKSAHRHGVHDDTLHGLQGACDLVHFRSIGAQGIVLGPGALDVAHKPDEFVREDELVASSLIYRDTVLELLQRSGASS